MSEDYSVKGSSLTSKFEFVAERFGEAARTTLQRRFEDRTGLFPVLDSSWYPFSLYDEVIRVIADLFYGGQLARLTEVGAYSAGKVLTGVYRAYAQAKDFASFLERASTLHRRFYSHGEMRVAVAPAGDQASVHLCEAPAYSEADLHVAAGFYRGAAELFGLQSFAHHWALREDGAHFELRWT